MGGFALQACLSSTRLLVREVFLFEPCFLNRAPRADALLLTISLYFLQNNDDNEVLFLFWSVSSTKISKGAVSWSLQYLHQQEQRMPCSTTQNTITEGRK